MTDPRTCAACDSLGVVPGPRGDLPCPQCNPASPGYARVGRIRPDPDAKPDGLVKALAALHAARERGMDPESYLQDLARAWAAADGSSAHTRLLHVRLLFGGANRAAA